jgi:hypothetical protein
MLDSVTLQDDLVAISVAVLSGGVGVSDTPGFCSSPFEHAHTISISPAIFLTILPLGKVALVLPMIAPSATYWEMHF